MFAARNNKENAMKNRKLGFTLVEIMIVVAIIGLLAAIAIPSFLKARTNSQKNGCIENLRQIDGAKEEWAMENKKNQGDSVSTTDVIAYLKDGKFPSCPGGGAYTLGAIGTAVSCNIGTHTTN